MMYLPPLSPQQRETLTALLRPLLEESRQRVLQTFPGIWEEWTNVRSAYLGRYSAIRQIMELLDAEIEEGSFVPEGTRTPEEEVAINRFVARARTRLEGLRPWDFEQAQRGAGSLPGEGSVPPLSDLP